MEVILKIFKWIKNFLNNTKCVVGLVALILIIAGVGNPVIWAICFAAVCLVYGLGELITEKSNE